MADASLDISTFFQSWSSAYYDATTKRWVQGIIYLNLQGIAFLKGNGKEAKTAESEIFIKFSDIQAIRKAQSSLLFPSITMVDNTKQIHWFSSFSDRNSTFLIIQHFYQASLLRKREPHRTSDSTAHVHQRTDLGTELLKNIRDSHQTLTKSAANLSKQSSQLTSSECVMHDMHQDLGVMERVTAGLSSWFGRWRVPATTKPDELILVKGHDIPDVLDSDVLYSHITTNLVGPQTEGVCQVSKSGLAILNMQQKVVQNFKWSDVSCVRAISSWEIVVSKFLIGQPDVNFSLIGVSMPAVLKKIQNFAPHKIEYDRHQSSSSACSPKFNLTNAKCSGADITTLSSPEAAISSLSPRGQGKKSERSQQQHQVNKGMVSEVEAEELSSALIQLKALALDVQEEQNSQLKVLDRLSDSVTKADDRLRAVNQKMNALLK